MSTIMSTYIVAFEVEDINQKNALKESIKKYGTYCPINDNCWAIVSEDTPVNIRDNLSSNIGVSDNIFIVRSGTYSAWRNLYGDKHTQWLKEHL